jgi:hypothetical protein
VVLLFACIEASHIHSTLLEKNDSCVLCHANTTLDQALPTQTDVVILYWGGFFKAFLSYTVLSIPLFYFAPIRAPPLATQHL